MKKKFVRLISAVLSAAMMLTAVPLSAFAEGEGHTHDGESNVITTPLDFREKTADENGDGWSWDYDTKTLTLNGVNIQATTEENMMSVVTVPDGTEIVLNGNNTIVQTNTGDSDTYVLSAVNTNDVNCDGTMTISGDGVLNAENRSTDSMARSLGGSIILNGGTVNATGTVKTNSLEIHNDGVLNANATTASFEGVAVNVSGGITVDGNGSLTAVGCANESTLNSAILLTSNFGDKISVSENGSITVPEGNAARVGIYYSGNNGDGMDAEISGGKVTAYGAKYGIYKVNLIMSGTGSVYTTGGSYAIGQTVPTIDEDEFVVKGSTESKASESAVTGEVKLNGGYYEIDGADAKTVVIKPDTSPRIILGKQTGIFKTEEYEIIEGMDMTDTKLKGTVYFDITLKNMSDEEFADARGYFGGDEPDLLASIIKTDYGWVCMVCDTEFSTTYDTDNTLTIKCGDIVSNTVQVKSNANRFNKVTQGDNTNRTVFYTNTSQEEKDNYKLVSTYTVDSESISYNWYSTNSAYSADELGAAVSGSNGEFKLADNIPAGNYVLYCDITYSDGDSTETVTEKFTFTYKECAHENGYSDGKCTNCGALCDHSDIDINTGKCNECAHQFVATISTDGNAPTGYDTLADCLDSITAETGNYVKIYQDIGDASATATLDTIDVKHNVMIDLNGHKLNNIKLGVNKDVTLTLTGTAGSYVTQVYVRKGGSFVIDSAANPGFNTIFVEAGAQLTVSEGAKVTTEQLTVIASVADDGTTTTSVKLATGMKLGGLSYHSQNNSGVLKLGNLLDVTRQALRREDNGNYLDLYKEYGSMGYSVALTVVEHTDADHKYGSGTGRCEECGKPCEHGGDINTDTGICSICGAVVSVAIYTDANGISKYVDTDELHSLLNEYNGSGTIKLFKDYDNSKAQYDLYGELTIDLNGRQFKIRSITPCKSGKLTIKNSGNPVMLGCNVYPTNDASYAGGTLIIDGDVVLDTSIYVYDSSTVILKAGAYQAGLYARDSKTLYDMLGEGKAFFKTDGTLFNANVKEISSSETLTIKDHSHTYVDGECGCGYVCPHSDVNSETGKCNECEYQYAAVIVKDGAVASVYEENEMGAAFEAADSDANTGCTLKVYKNYAGSYTTLSGKFTLWIAEKANVGTLTVSGDITVTGSEKSNSFYGDFYVAAGGKLTFDKKCGAMGTVTVGAGTFDCYYSFVTTLNINDESSDVILHDGTFKTICYNGGGDRANAEILTLLAENRMFMKYPNAEPIDGSKTLLKDGLATVFVASHEDHSYDSTTGKCTICGKRCGHTDVDSKTGVCSTCKYQLTAGISGVGTAKYFDNIDDAFTAALSAENNGCTLTLYKHCEITQNVEIGNTTVAVDVNGCSLGGEADISVNNGGVLYLKDSRKSTYYGCIDAPFSVNGGTLINGTADGGSSAADVLNLVINSAKCVEIYGGIFENVYIAHASGVALYGGRYNTICGEESNTPVNALLAKGYAFATVQEFTTLPESIVDGSAVTLSEGIRNVTVVKHTDADHKYSSGTGKCVCGYVCPHSDVDSKTGVCSICEYQLTAGISSAGTAKYFDNIDDAFTAALSAENNGCTLTLYKDCELSQNIVIGNATLTVDVNGHFISPEIRGIDVNDGGVLYLKNSGENGSIGLEMAVNKGGTLINGTADDSSSAVSLFAVTADAAECVEFYGGSCTYLTIKNGTSGIALYGGYYDIICGSLTDNTPVNDLLAKGYAFATLNSVTHLPESIVDGSAKTIGEGIRNVTVVAHEHRYNVETGKCPCGVCALAIFTETTQSSETYTFIESETQFKNIAENEADGVLKLTGDVDCIVKGIIINGNKTIDMNGHTLNVSVGTEEISAVAVYGNVTFENSGSSRAVINATGVYSYGMVTVNGDIEFDTFATFEDGDALINAGVFKSIYVQGRSVIEILGSGKALASESGEILNASVQQIYKAGDNIFVTAHPKHTYDDHGNCACGYKCLHDGEGQVDEDSANKVCSECGAKIYAKVTTADGKVKYFDDITEGLRYADKAENKGCVFTLVTSGKINSGVRLSNGQFTITTSNYGTIYDYNQTITIDGADVIAEGYMFIRCKVNVKSGSLTLPEGSSAGFDSIAISGGTVTVSEGVNVDNHAGADNLFVSEDATDAKLTIGGGTYGRIVLGQHKFKDVLASGVRVISYDNPTDPTAEKTAKALLYSDIAEKNNFDSENNTVSYYLFTKCEHKNEDGSYAFNEGGICKYCNSEFAASVSYTVDGSAKTELFSDICDAFDKANEIGTATVTLYKDITDSERTQEITVMGNVTLELNGKTLGGRYGIARISVSDGGTLTVNGDGNMDTPIYVNENSKLVINGGGYFNSVSVKKGGNAEIGGGTIRGLSVRGNVKLSGGKFNDIEIFNGNLESVLADGYAYKNADGTWLSIDEREKDSYLGGSKGALSVEEAPIKSASISWAGGEAPVIYRNGAKKLKVNVTCDVADTSKRITYSDFVNGNNRSKDSKLSVNWYMVFGYKIGEIVAEDGEVEYYTVLKCDGYEYKSNVLKFTLATCSHPEDSFNNETDGLVFCGICDLLIEAEVVDADGKSLGYAGLNRAIKLAQENEGSTVKLISERVPASITVTGGKFTVDFNGKEAYYQFTVNGGDVTFTSSAVQDVSNQNLPSGITVNGTDAEVTIDGKIKLGSVTISSGALAVNSAESYIKELSINGGKTVVNGANIDALKANGGDTVINYVTADSLSVNINGSGSISIVTGEFGSTTCKTDSGYTLGMAIASGSVVFGNSMNGITVYTYEAIQTMTKTDRIFVDKCVHKDGSGSYVLDGNPCPYCNEEIVATVSYTANGSENTDLFSDIYDAFDKANEIGTATVTLQKNITDDITDTIAVTGNVTLELNGKRLSQPGTDVWYSIEVTSGKLTVNGSGLIKRVAVRNGSNAEINGGTFSDFIIKDGGNAVIKGGQFYSLQVSGEGRNVGQLLADGYAYRSIIDSGIWSTIAEREKQDITNVEVKEAPIKSATATANKTVLYRNGGGARQILFNFNVNTSDGYTISDANKVTVGLYVGDTLIRELDFVGNSYTFANADEISDTDGTVKAHLVIKLNGYEYVTDDVEFEIATCTHPYDALTTDEYDYYRCSLCDASINAILVKTNGDKACYTDNVPEAFEAAQLEENNGCTLELYRGVNRDCEITQGSFTVLFKKTGSASAVIKVSGGNVKITGDDGCTLSKYPGSSVGYLIAVTGGTVTFDDITINDDSISVSGGKTVINGGTYNKLSVSGGTVTINSGTFSSIDVSAEGKALKDLLGENKAFTTSDGKLFDASKVSESDMSLTVIDHSKHEYDETGRCGCGYQCAHSEINAEGVCNECNAKMYVAVTVKSETGTTVKYFTKLTEAFEFAAKNENKGCTLKMLRDFFDRNTDINVNGGELTVDMNGFGVYFNSFNGSGTQITIRSDSKCTFGVENGFSMDGGTVTFSGEVSVVCQNVKLNATYFSSYVETLKIDTLILEDGVLLKQLASITNANIANIDCSSEIYLYQILASGSRVDSQLYSDLKANASSNFDNVRIIRCDHPDGVGRDNRCIYCNSLIAASVSYTENGAEKTEYFVKEDLGKAFAKANSVASATITMLMSSAYDTDYLPVTGDVTLIANGDNAILYNTVKVADGGKLTLRGNANIFAVIAEPGSRLTAEEATRIAYLTVNGGDVKLSGGQYDNITVKDGKITDILGNGYAYKKTEGGAWLTLKEREVSEASGVTVAKAPIVQATLSTEINQLYRNSNANPTLKFNLALAHGSNLNDSYVSKRYGINSYVSGDIIYSSLSALVKDAKLSADEIIDKAGNSVAAKIYFVVITDDGYEIKSNTVSIDLVDCDHSQVVDPTADKETSGNITEPTYCEICESKFNAKITKGDDVKYYNNLDEAAKDAQKSENEGCTLYPLYNKNGYGGQLVITEGNFTLKYAVRTAFSRPIIINGKAKLTVTGRCAVTAFENQDAFIVRGGDVTFDGLATGSNVTINGGNVTMAANNINCLTINGGNVSISSGGFAEIVTTVSDKVIADYIDHGFWVQDRGTKEWIDIYSLNKATASSTNGLTVRLCPMQIIKPIDTVYYTNGYYPDGIPSLQISAVPWYSGEVDAKVAYQWIAIDENGYETVIEGATDRKLSLENLTTGRYYCRLTYSNATTAGVSMKSDVVTATITECEHSGGEATCTEKAKCEICGAEYGETKPHSYAQIKSPEYLKSAATCTAKAVYYTSCTNCGLSSKGTADEATFEYGNALGHKYGEWVSNGDGTHSRVCANDNKHIETKACHGGKATCTAKAICEDCGKAYGEMAAHTFTAKTAAAKYLKSAATCTAKAVYYTSCADCGLSSKGTKNEATFEYGNALGHKYGEWVSNGDGTHTRVCANDSTHTETKACHGGKATCTAKAICEDCGKAYGEMAAHTFTAKSTVSRYLKRAATCTEKSEYYVSCAGCGLSSKGTASEAVFTGSALGHSLTEWSVITEVTCTTNGTQERHCTRCDYKQTRTVVAKGHSYGLWNVTKKVGCITDGEQSRECSVCGNKETKTIAATGVHSYGSWKVAKAATCTTTGTKVRSCLECGAKETVIIQPTGHKYVESTVKPTYTEKGYILHKCSECGTSYKSSYTDKLVLASVSGVKLAGRAADALRVSWKRNTSADGYIVEIYKDGAWARAGKITTDSTTDFRVTGLKASTFYKFRVRAYKMSGNTAVYSDYGTTLTARTNPSVITGAKLAGRAADALRISWDRNTSADGYIVEIYKDGAWSRAVKTTNNSITTYRAEGLKASTVYKLRVRAYKMDGTAAYYGNYSAEVTARTNPSVIKGAKLAGRAADALRISWERNTSADGYIVEVYKDGAWARAGKITTDSTTDFRVTGLKASTVYKLRVRAYKMSGTAAYYGNYSAEVTARTNPSVMTGVKIGGTAKDALRINWSKNTSAQGYIVEMAQNGEWVRVAKITDNSTTTFRKAGLAKNTSYRFRVCAYHMSGSTPLYGTYVSVSGKTAAN